MIALLTILISVLYATVFMQIFDKYAYDDDYPLRKVHVPNILKILFYLICLLPYFNILFSIGVTGINISIHKWKGWEENKLLYWLFK